MVKTTQIAADRTFDQTKTVLPAEVARGVYMQHAPSLQALKLMHLMIGKAGARMADDTRHDVRLSEIRKIDGMKNHDRASLTPLFGELASAVLIHDDTEAKRVTIGGLLDEAMMDYRDEVSGDLLVSWYFGRTFRRMAGESNHWAILDRQTVFHLGSKYSVLLFQHISSLTGFDYITSKKFTVPELRAVLGVSDRKLSRFADLNARAIQPAIAEINQLSRLTLTVKTHKIGRTISEVEIAWEMKPDLASTKRELDSSKVGRKARRDGTAEAVPFPDSGSIAHDKFWVDVKQRAGCNMDNSLIADKFRASCKGKGIPLTVKHIEAVFFGYAKTIGRV